MTLLHSKPNTASTPGSSDDRTTYRRYALVVIALVLVFSWPLFQLVRFSLHEDLFSYILLIPLVSAYFAWTNRKELTAARPGAVVAAVPLVIGIALGVGYVATLLSGPTVPTADTLALSTGAFVALFIGITILFLGSAVTRRLLFPLGFLILMVPIPTAIIAGTDTMLQHTSALTADLMIRSVGTPVWRDGLIFRVPGIAIQVAPECSGIRSTLVLMITSLVAGQLLLRSPWRRTLLVFLVLPLGILRNGFRIFTIAELCVHIGPQMIDSPIHHKGGPLFFVLSLIPFALVLLWLAKSERRADQPPAVIATGLIADGTEPET